VIDRGTYFDSKLMKGLFAISGTTNNAGLDPIQYELIKMRASQINGCSFCLKMHIEGALAAGETQERINLLSMWRDTPYFSEKERAVLALTEAVTLIAADQVPDAVFEEVQRHFSQDEIASLVLAIITINAWNRANIAFGVHVGAPVPA